jgi:hypothetical protein
VSQLPVHAVSFAVQLNAVPLPVQVTQLPPQTAESAIQLNVVPPPLQLSQFPVHFAAVGAQLPDTHEPQLPVPHVAPSPTGSCVHVPLGHASVVQSLPSLHSDALTHVTHAPSTQRVHGLSVKPYWQPISTSHVPVGL